MNGTRYVSGLQLARLLGEVPRERPLYAGLAGAVRGLVQDGRLALRTRLPAERDLASALGVSRTTVTAAYDRLRAEGYVESRQGAGSWTTLPGDGSTALPTPGASGGVVPRYGMAHAPDAEAGFIDLGCAAPAVPAVFHEAVEAAVAALPRHYGGPGYEPAGLPELREMIAAGYAARGVPTHADQIIVTNGAQHALGVVAEMYLTPGDGVLVERPTYPNALDALRRRGARLVPVGVGAGWDIELVGGAMRQAAVRLGYLIPDFQNPTGHLMGDEDRAALVAAARSADALLVVDETFAGLALDPAAPEPVPVAAHDRDGRVISIGSVSKLMWGGLRIGWIRASAPVARRIALARESMDMASPVLDQVIVRELLLRAGEVRAERIAVLTAGRDALAAALHEHLPDWTFRMPPGGMSLWVSVGAPVAARLAELAARRGVRVVAGPVFGADGVLEDRLRLPFVLPPATLREAVARLALAREDLQEAPPARPVRVLV
ncbi:MocR-like transcription factor YczR [Actinomadura rupiterrae]|uniref:MocR-like transcription factor YczR n=1 Tax=Actinomadura rupiterrae TaxID=559627 RepID=UPI0020A31005|nr:PLP-dependent aminotransferase family protein [Actinomadura rupiterrae]MCP2341309.1 DNA-binding transcriptional MocR family regulator [Actinomadura rupiterrae]